MKKRQNISQLSLYRQLFRDNRQFIRIIKVLEEEMATDGASYQLEVETIPDGHQCLVNYSHPPDLTGPAKKDDLWLAIFLGGDLNNGYLIQRLANMSFPIHQKTRMGETVLGCRRGKRINLSNNSEAKLTENLMLGPEFVVWLLKLTEQIKSLADDIESLKNSFNRHQHSVAAQPGPPTGIPTFGNTGLSLITTSTEKTKITELEQTTETDKFLSDLAYIQEKGLNEE